ncbi:membrane proteins related to metalloendopeptidases [Cutibacterium acnes JCM 18918]|nr:membrane proteins related to metalloendopeptidases [Cutibacterium acnes JCM 18918]
MLALPAPSHSVAAVPARSVANRPTPPVLGPVIKGLRHLPKKMAAG